MTLLNHSLSTLLTWKGGRTYVFRNYFINWHKSRVNHSFNRFIMDAFFSNNAICHHQLNYVHSSSIGKFISVPHGTPLVYVSLVKLVNSWWDFSQLWTAVFAARIECSCSVRTFCTYALFNGIARAIYNFMWKILKAIFSTFERCKYWMQRICS